MPIIAVIGGCGGAGASTVAAALALAAVRGGRRTALFDADPLGPGLESLIASAAVPIPAPRRHPEPGPQPRAAALSGGQSGRHSAPAAAAAGNPPVGPGGTAPFASPAEQVLQGVTDRSATGSAPARPDSGTAPPDPGATRARSGCGLGVRAFAADGGTAARPEPRTELVPPGVPRRPDLALISWGARPDGAGLPVAAIRDALRALREVGRLVIVDLPRSLDDAAHLVLAEATHTLLVSPVAERAAVAAGRLLPRLTLTGPLPHLVLRLPARDQFTARDIAILLGLPVAGVIRPGGRARALGGHGDEALAMRPGPVPPHAPAPYRGLDLRHLDRGRLGADPGGDSSDPLPDRSGEALGGRCALSLARFSRRYIDRIAELEAERSMRRAVAA